VIKSIVIGVFLPLALFASSISSFASASEPSDIGFVLYTRSDSPGTLNARWMHGEQYRGPGIATGGPRDGFAGEYHVRYFFENGDFSDEYDLVIARTGDTNTFINPASFSLSLGVRGKASARSL